MDKRAQLIHGCTAYMFPSHCINKLQFQPDSTIQCGTLGVDPPIHTIRLDLELQKVCCCDVPGTSMLPRTDYIRWSGGGDSSQHIRVLGGWGKGTEAVSRVIQDYAHQDPITLFLACHAPWLSSDLCQLNRIFLWGSEVILLFADLCFCVDRWDRQIKENK